MCITSSSSNSSMFCYLYHSARSHTPKTAYVHTYPYVYRVRISSGRSLSAHAYNVYMWDGCLPSEEDKKEQFVTSPDKYVHVYHKSNHLPVRMKRLIGTSCVSVWVFIVVAVRANNMRWVGYNIECIRCLCLHMHAHTQWTMWMNFCACVCVLLCASEKRTYLLFRILRFLSLFYSVLLTKFFTLFTAHFIESHPYTVRKYVL